MQKLLRGILIAVGIACFGVGYYLYNNFLNPPEIAVVSDNNYHVENTDDGSGTVKLVMVKGKLKVKEPVEDDSTGVKSRYPIMKRVVEMYQYFPDGEKTMMGWKDHQIKSFKDSKGREWKNPDFPSGLKSKTFYHDFLLGEGNLPISHRFLQQKLDKEKYKDSFYYLKNLPKECRVKDFEWKDSYYLKSAGKKNRIGDVRIYYKVLKYDDLPELTILGQQKNGKVIYSNDDCRFYDRDVTMDEIVKTYTQDSPHAALAAVFFGTFFIVLGVFKGER
ncbi:MAG: TMEM43 family protein [Selenomonadaceae bacterium]|nr:TMEM43 family protein [Selenomonadaceae bacterium]